MEKKNYNPVFLINTKNILLHRKTFLYYQQPATPNLLQYGKNKIIFNLRQRRNL